MSQYVVVWPAAEFPWVVDDEGVAWPDQREDRPLVYGPFADAETANAFRETLGKAEAEAHRWPYTVIVDPPERSGSRADDE